MLRPVNEFASSYETKDWEEEMRKARTVVDTRSTGREPRELMLGVEHNGAARAYVLERLLKQKLVQDAVGGMPVIVVVGPDEKSIRVFESRCRDTTRFPSSIGNPKRIPIDQSSWIQQPAAVGHFRGCAVTGPATGQCLKPVPALKDYWFDWQLYHPNTTVHSK